jgi:hypothetical protein
MLAALLPRGQMPQQRQVGVAVVVVAVVVAVVVTVVVVQCRPWCCRTQATTSGRHASTCCGC